MSSIDKGIDINPHTAPWKWTFTYRWGVIEKCPYCERTNIKRGSSNQTICGSPHCKAERDKASAAKAPAEHKAELKRRIAARVREAAEMKRAAKVSRRSS